MKFSLCLLTAVSTLGSHVAQTTEPHIRNGQHREAWEIEQTYNCPPIPKKPWYCPFCSADTTKLDTYNEIMDLFDGPNYEDPAKAITVWFGKSSGKVASFNDEELSKVLTAASLDDKQSCVRAEFEDAVCFTLEHSSIFNAESLTTLQKLKGLLTFAQFLIGIADGNPVAVAKNTKKLITDIVIPTLSKVIGDISFVTLIDPGNKFKRDVYSCIY